MKGLSFIFRGLFLEEAYMSYKQLREPWEQWQIQDIFWLCVGGCEFI